MPNWNHWSLVARKNLWIEILKASGILFILLLAIPVEAKDNSLLVHGGWEHTASSVYGDSGTLAVRAEHRLYRGLFGGLEYNYHGGMSHSTGQDVSYGDVSGHSVLADLIVRVDVGKLEPYMIGGLGWSWWDFKRESWVEDSGVTIDLGNEWCYKVGFGADYPINESWSFNVEWSFFKSDVPKVAKNPDGSDSSILGDDNKHGHITIGEEETRLVAGLRYKF